MKARYFSFLQRPVFNAPTLAPIAQAVPDIVRPRISEEKREAIIRHYCTLKCDGQRGHVFPADRQMSRNIQIRLVPLQTFISVSDIGVSDPNKTTNVCVCVCVVCVCVNLWLCVWTYLQRHAVRD